MLKTLIETSPVVHMPIVTANIAGGPFIARIFKNKIWPAKINDGSPVETHTETLHGQVQPPLEQFTIEHQPADPPVVPSRSRTIFLITTLTGIMFVASMSTGLLTISLPRIAQDLKLSSSLLLW